VLGRADRFEPVVVGGLPEKIDRDHTHWGQALGLGRLDPDLKARRIDIECLFVDIYKHWRRAKPGYDLGGGRKGKARAKYRVLTLQTKRRQDETQRVGAVRT
jgi:hypothetical protein